MFVALGFSLIFSVAMLAAISHAEVVRPGM
jgi:hypothetical protein